MVAKQQREIGNELVKGVKYVHFAVCTFMLAIVLLSSCSSQQSSDRDNEETPSDRTLETNAVACNTGLQLKYSSGITSIFEDSKGRFWFGSQKEGVCLSIGNELRYFTTNDGLSDNQIRTIQEDQAGVLWFATGNGITSFDVDGFEIRTNKERKKAAAFTGAKALPTGTEGLWFHGDDSTHRGFDGQGVYRYDGVSLSYLDLPVPDEVEGHDPYLVTNIAKGKNRTVWFGTYPGVFRYDSESFTVINDKTVGIRPENDRLHVRSLLEDSQGRLWIGNNGLGVLLYDGQSVSNFTEQHGLSIREKGPRGSLGRVFSIVEDAAGNIWFGTRDNGAWRFNGQSLTNFTKEDGLTSTSVWIIYRDKRDALWFGMSDGCVCRFNGASFDRIY